VDTNAVAVLGQWIMSLPVRVPELPKAWHSLDIGPVGMTGAADFLNGRFNLLASGKDIWEAADEFRFASRPLAGDGSVVARVISVQYTDPWAKAGVMMRENDSPGAKYVFLALTGQGGSALQWRSQPDGPSTSLDGPEGKPPRWIKLTRTGSIVSGFTSADGVNWVAAGSVTNAMSRKLSAGLAVTAHNNRMLNSTLFENVSVGGENYGLTRKK
jgi:hypothetical protein